ncbi:MAG: YicC family protein [Candidatus Omnitrophica bacterium]|nr:YicC family protein [Candidatus Omnitrophota bacterium]
MIRSMTGFGRGHANIDGGAIAVEIKTVNHKFFDATLKLPPGLAMFEDDIKEILQKHIKRGKVSLNMVCDGKLFKAEKVSINRDAARAYYEELKSLKKSLGLQEAISIKDIIVLPGVLSVDAAGRITGQLWPQVKKALEAAITNLLKDRIKEGKSLYKDLSTRSKHIKAMLAIIRSRAHLNIEEYRKRFAERIRDLTGGNDINMGRLEMEVAIYAKNSDIAEEITRLQNHLANFDKTITANDEVGKKLDFIAQELHRETNTIGSKASDFKISKHVIEIKGEIEKIREQAKNLE